jgi:hypothetical protein
MKEQRETGKRMPVSILKIYGKLRKTTEEEFL